MSLSRAAVLACLALACGPVPVPVARLDWSAPVKPTMAPAALLPRLVVKGAAIVRAIDGGELRLRGVNVCSLEFDATGANWESSDGGSALLDTLSENTRWNANVVRMPVNQQWFLEDPEYQTRVERLIDDANARGVYVILDVQWEVGKKLEPYYLNILEVPTFGPGNTTEAFWLVASSRWANRTNLLYDLINEPHGRHHDESAAAMQVLIDAIRSRTPDPILVIGGSDWAHGLDFYRQRPLTGANLVYSAHQYLPYDTPDKFSSNFLQAARTLPVIVGEFVAEPENAAYATRLVDESEKAGVDGWLPWAIGCGFARDDDLGREPLHALAGTMRALNR